MAKSEKYKGELQSFWRAVFNQSRVNGAPYRGEYLPAHSWIWPRGTFLQRRLRSIKAQEPRELSSEDPAEEYISSLLERSERSASPRLRLVDAAGGEQDDHEKVAPRQSPAAPASRAEAGRLSPTQALLGLERQGWARVSNGAVQPVEVNERSVQAALRKENMESFQQTLVQSGQWVRSHGAAPAEVQAPVAAAAPASAEPAAKPAPVAQAGHAAANPTASQPAVTPAAQQVPGWDDIDEKLLWLAKPSN